MLVPLVWYTCLTSNPNRQKHRNTQQNSNTVHGAHRFITIWHGLLAPREQIDLNIRQTANQLAAVQHRIQHRQNLRERATATIILRKRHQLGMIISPNMKYF